MRFEFVVVVVVDVLLCYFVGTLFGFRMQSKASRFIWSYILLSLHLRQAAFLYNKHNPVKT
jgi:hypothetical protein